MRGLVFALLAAAFVASVLGTRYTGRRFINLGITGILAPVNAGYNRDTLSRFGSISGSSLSRTFDSTFLAGGVTGGRSIGLSSVNPYLTRSITIRGVTPFSGRFQSYNEFGREPYVPGDGPYGFDEPLSGFGPGGDDLGPLGSGGPLSGDRINPYPGGPLDGPGLPGMGTRSALERDLFPSPVTFPLIHRGGVLYNRGNDRSGSRYLSSVSSGGPGLNINLGGGDDLGFSIPAFDALEGQGALGRGTGSSGRSDLGDRFSSSGFSSSSRAKPYNSLPLFTPEDLA